uniref:CSON001913 protein n=1 Tax=Culicoides sonorensis TaxID=179676 RepID=A0A336L0Z7_CULSO
MAPKRKDKETEMMVKPKPDAIQVDNELFLLAFEIEARERKSNGLTFPNKFLSLLFVGFYDKLMEEVEQDQGLVKVEVILIKHAQNKRKETSAAVQTSIGSIEVMVNPHDISIGHIKVPAISIPVEQFDTNSPTPSTHTLIFRIEHCPNKILTENNADDQASNNKKSKLIKTYSTELVVTDKMKSLLEEGEYDLTVQDITNMNFKFYSPKKLTGMSWETLNASQFDYIDAQNSMMDDFSYDELFSKEPTLKFHLQWTKDSLSGYADRPAPIVCAESNKENQSNGLSLNGNTPSNDNNNTVELVNEIKSEPPAKKVRIIYHFVYNNNSRQQTEDSSDFHCPWCSLNCQNMYALLKHLKLCHARFVFTYVPIPEGARIDVSLNENYDGSYVGSPHDLLKSGGFSRASGPVRRSTVTNILVCRPRRTKHSLSEFLELDENEFDSQRPYISGHNRLYHHTMTCLPVLPKELDIDSEGESNPNWLKHKTIQMIDEFTDVNEGEKELMKLWNLHVMRFGYVGDCQIPIACDMFVEHKGKELLEKNVYKNFILHMCSLFDFGLISPENFYTTVQKIQKILNQSEEARIQLTKRNEEQAEYWKTTGIFKQIEQQKLAEEQKKKDLAEKKRQEDTKLVITATDEIQASTSSGNKTVSASVKTTSTTTVNNKNLNGTANSNRNRKSLNLSTNHNSQSNTNNTKFSNKNNSDAMKLKRGIKRRVGESDSQGSNLSLKRRRSAGSIQVSSSPGDSGKIKNRRNTFLATTRRRSTVTAVPANLAESLPKNAYPKIVLTRKSISGTHLGGGGGASIKTRQSTGNIPTPKEKNSS